MNAQMVIKMLRMFNPNKLGINKGELQMGEKAEIIIRALYNLGGTATFTQIVNEISIEDLQTHNLNKKKIKDLLYHKEPYYLQRKYKHNGYAKDRKQVYIIKQRVIDWFQKQDANKH